MYSRRYRSRYPARIRGSGAYVYGRNRPFGHYAEKVAKYVTPMLFGGRGAAFTPYARRAAAYLGNRVGRLFGSGAYRYRRTRAGKYIPSYRGAHRVIKGSGAYTLGGQGKLALDTTSPPSFGSNRTIVRHREFIQNIQGSTDFNIQSFNVNPGDEVTFPWLSALAVNYEKYRPIGIAFEFKSTSSNALSGTNTALGSVMMAPRYNAINQSEPESKLEMLQIENCSSICPADSTMVGIECAKNYNPLGVLYNRKGGDIPAGSEQLYDFCNFYIATEGMQAVATIGELWVTYEIELLTPILGGGQVGDEINFANYNIAAGITNSNYFNGITKAGNYDGLELEFGTNEFTIKGGISTGCYIGVLVLQGDNTSNVIAPGPIFSTSTVGINLMAGLSTFRAPNATTTTGRPVSMFAFQVTGLNPTIAFSATTIPTNIVAGYLQIYQVPMDADN